MIDWSDTGKAVHLALAASGLSPHAFREAVGISRPQFWRLRHGYCKPRLATRQKIEAYLDARISQQTITYQKNDTDEIPSRSGIARMKDAA